MSEKQAKKQRNYMKNIIMNKFIFKITISIFVFQGFALSDEITNIKLIIYDDLKSLSPKSVHSFKVSEKKTDKLLDVFSHIMKDEKASALIEKKYGVSPSFAIESYPAGGISGMNGNNDEFVFWFNKNGHPLDFEMSKIDDPELVREFKDILLSLMIEINLDNNLNSNKNEEE